MKDKLKEFKPLWKFVKEDKKKIVIASVCILIVEFACTLNGYLNGMAVEAITEDNLKLALIYLGIYLIVGLVFDAVMYETARSSLTKVESKITRKLGYNTYCKALDLPAYAYEKTSSGEIINRINNDADTLSFAFLHILELISSIVSAIMILIYILFNSWIIAIEILIFLIILFFIINYYNPILIKLHKERKKEQDKLITLTNESIRGIREVKTLGIKKHLRSDSSNINEVILDKSLREISTNKNFKLWTNFLKNFMEVSVFITCAILLYNKNISLAFFIAMTYYVYRYMHLIENINTFTETFQKTYVSLTRVNEILENRLYDDEKFGDSKLNNVKGIIEFKNVTFAYPNEGNLLNDFNIKLEPNKKIAIVGRSGQGKSTLFNLLTRVFDANDGVISLDGQNIKELDEYTLRKEISIIRQDPFIFNRTIMDNFKMVDENITLEEVRKYCKEAYIDDYIMSLPDKYDTLLGEGGVNLSGGQKQRLSIARTLSKKSKVILFDEATSALDNESQEYIKKTIDNLVNNHTIIIVAHRLSTIMDADIIYVVDKGKVIDSGSHTKLLKTCQTYKKLYETESLNS